MQNQITLSNLLSVTVLLIFLAGCGGPSKDSNAESTSADTLTLTDDMDTSTVITGMDIKQQPEVSSRRIRLGEFDCLRNDFSRFFRYFNGKGDTVALNGYIQYLQWSDVVEKVEAFTVDDDHIRGLKLYHGLRADGNGEPQDLQIGVELVEMRKIPGDIDGTTYAITPDRSAFYVIDEATMTLQPAELNEWFANQQATYFRDVVWRRSNRSVAFSALDINGTKNLRYQIHEWEESLDKLRRHNEPEGTLLTIQAISEPHVRAYDEHNDIYIEEDPKHLFGLYSSTAQFDELIDPDGFYPFEPYKKKATDLGSPCPPLCQVKAEFLNNGMEPRKSCE